MNTLAVELANHSYPIHVGEGLLSDADLYSPYIGPGGVLVVTNETIGPLYLDKVLGALDGVRVESVALPDGESFKTFATLNRIFDVLIEHRFGRDVTIIALGVALSETSQDLQPRVTNAASITSRFPLRSSPKSIRRSAGKLPLTILAGRT